MDPKQSQGIRKRRFMKRRKGTKRVRSPVPSNFRLGNALKTKFCTHCNTKLTNAVFRRRRVREDLRQYKFNEYE